MVLALLALLALLIAAAVDGPASPGGALSTHDFVVPTPRPLPCYLWHDVGDGDANDLNGTAAGP